MEKIYFAKLRDSAIIPSKIEEDAGYDVYACFEDEILVIAPNEIKLIPTGIVSAFSKDYFADLRERGSSGTKGLSKRCGVIDSGYRGEWFVSINNTTNKRIVIAKKNWLEKYKGSLDNNTIYYPYEKAICQFVLLPVPKTKVIEISHSDILEFSSERGVGKIGSSGK